MKPVKNVTSATVIGAGNNGPRAGQLIGDRYRLDRPLERGAMGSVWRAEQVRLRAPVAVKFLDPSLIGDKEMHDRFMQEARSSAAVRSAHVVQVFDYGTEEGVPYIAMELLDGENLDARLGARGTLTPAELDRLFAEVARGIGQAHAIGVIHRDLKPGNIFIAREGEHEVTKIVDFGIAKVKASALRLTQDIGTQLGTLLGTPQYMSPEQVRGSGSIDHRTDLWALAIIACECLTGSCPFAGETIGDLTVQICTERPPAPSSLGPVPPGFDTWFFKATQKKPNKRFQTVEEMAERLHAVLAPAVAAAPGATRARRAGRLINLPSRSEVRLAYSAVVTWKGYVVSRLEETWAELRQLMQRVAHQPTIRWALLRQRVRERFGFERLAFLRPIAQRHGTFASATLLCCGILLLGLTTRNTDPAVVGPRHGMHAAGATPPLMLATPAPPTTPATELSPAPSERKEATRSHPTAPEGSLALQRRPGTEAAAASTPAPRDPSPERASAEPLGKSVGRGSKDSPAAGDSAAAVTKGKPITKAMARAAAKILNADDAVTSKPPAGKRAKSDATPRSRATRPKTRTRTSSSHPFDDRL